MARLRFGLQAVTKFDHASLLQGHLRLPGIKNVLISVAFCRTSGVNEIEDDLKRLGKRTTIFVGIRNDITSVQAVKMLLRTKARVMAVDTGSRHAIFHPKIYVTATDDSAHVVIGSANLTLRGLFNNIEASTIIELSRADAHDVAFLGSTMDTFDALAKTYPKHVFEIQDATHAEKLFAGGRLADEEVAIAPVVTSSVHSGVRDSIGRMPLPSRKAPSIKGKPGTTKAKTRRANGNATPYAAPGNAYEVVWTSKPLTERDLNIPSGRSTNPTGSMGLKKGLLPDTVDHRDYFRDEVFPALVWTTDPKKPGLDRAQAQFELVINNLNYGVFKLGLSHKTDKQSKTYLQNNFMTQLHWGEAKEHVAQRDLLDRALTLYRKIHSPAEFLIEID